MMPFEIQAHRGARSLYPENTIPAFVGAVEIGCPVIELDLVVSRDHRLVVAHDPWIDVGAEGAEGARDAGEAAPLRRYCYSMDYRQIASFDCGAVSPGFPLQRRINACRPTLPEVFDTVERHLRQLGRSGGMMYNLEVKSWPKMSGIAHPPPGIYAALVIADILESGLASRIRLQSFDSSILIEARKRLPDLTYGLLVEDPTVFGAFPGVPGFVPAYVNPHHTLLDRQLVCKLHDAGAKVIAWTVNSKDEMIRMRQIGADGIITDYPELALSLKELA